MRVLGIDPGLDGAMAILHSDQRVLIEPFPSIELKKGRVLDVSAISKWLEFQHRQERIDMAYLEMVSARPKQGVSSVFKFGRGFGNVEGILAALQIPYQLVPPKQWTSLMHAGIEGAEPKGKSKIAVSRLFPQLDLRASVRCKVPHEGIVDAVLLAEFGRRTYSAAVSKSFSS